MGGAIAIGSLAGGAQELTSELLAGKPVDPLKVGISAGFGALGSGLGGAYTRIFPYGRSGTALPDAVEMSNALRNVSANKPSGLGFGVGVGVGATNEISNTVRDSRKPDCPNSKKPAC